jgi:two-component system, LuxR family, sensor kinase FixL
MLFSPLNILVVDDDPDTRANLRDILELDQHQVETAGTAAEVLGRDDWSHYSAIILDRKLPDGTAEDLLPRLRELAPHASVLIVTGYSDLQGAIAALRQGAADYILKPINPEALRASLLRVADRHSLSLEKQRSEDAFRTLIDAAPCMIVILRPDHTIAYLSHFGGEVTAYPPEEVVGRDYVTLFVPDEYRAVAADDLEKVFTGTPLRSVERPVVCKDGSRRWMIWNARLLSHYEGGPAVLVVGQDITALKQAQERTLQAERLAAIGQMVTGLAHESGNALARSQACLEMLALEVEDRPQALELVDRIQKAQNHLQQLYEEVRNYAAPLKLEREPDGLDRVWRQAWTNLAGLRQGRQVALHERQDGADLCCTIDSFRLEQVFRNIFENALAACRDPAEITVTSSGAALEGLPAVCVSVTDNGPGMSAEQRQRIFEPFYTTKTKGTGLGMAIAHRIIEAHGGRISAGAAPQQGAEIVILLPRESQ